MKTSWTAQLSTALVLVLVSLGVMADVVDSPTERRLALSSGSSAMVLPRGGWVITKEKHREGGKAIYYALEDERNQLILSVFIQRSSDCRSADACLEAAMKNPTFQGAMDLRKSGEGPFTVALFFLDQPRGLPVFEAQLLASAYVDGQWFDVRISKLGNERPDPAPLLAVLRGLSIK